MKTHSADRISTATVGPSHRPLVLILGAVCLGIVADRLAAPALTAWLLVWSGGLAAWGLLWWRGLPGAAAVCLLAAVAAAMRRILIERARRKQGLKHGGDHQPVALDAIESVSLPLACDDVLGLDEALQKLAKKDARKAELVKLRFYAGLKVAEAAKVLDISTSTAENDWVYARSWLRLEMSGGSHSGIP